MSKFSKNGDGYVVAAIGKPYNYYRAVRTSPGMGQSGYTVRSKRERLARRGVLEEIHKELDSRRWGQSLLLIRDDSGEDHHLS